VHDQFWTVRRKLFALKQQFPTFFISFPIWCRPKVAVFPSYNHLIFASFSQPGGVSWAPQQGRPGRKRIWGTLSVAERLWLKETQKFCETFITAIYYTNSDWRWGQYWKLLPRSSVNIARGRNKQKIQIKTMLTNNNTNITVNNNNGCIYYSALLELIKSHLAIRVFSNAVRNIDKIRNMSILFHKNYSIFCREFKIYVWSEKLWFRFVNRVVGTVV